MIYRFNAYGHPNILGTHKTTLEFTKDKEVSLKGDCIVGIKAGFELSRLKRFIKGSKGNKLIVTIKTVSNNKNQQIQEKIQAELNPGFNHNKEFVIRKTDFVSERTFAIKADKAAFGLNRDLIEFLKKKESKISVVVENREK